MKVLLINTSDLTGGAAIACHRLLEAHLSNQVDVQLLVQDKTKSTNKKILQYKSKWPIKQVNLYAEKFIFLPKEASKENRFAFSTAQFGEKIHTHNAVKEADIIHLHWINHGYLSLSSLQQLAALNKPIVWTLHDMWAFTGGCHYSDACTNYQKACGNCYYIKNNHPHDLSNQIWSKKMKIYQNENFHFVTCSRWLQSIAQSSSLLSSCSVDSIPNPIDNTLYKPFSNFNPDKYTILFQAMNLADTRKGLQYFLESLGHIKNHFPKLAKRIKLLVFGKSKGIDLNSLGFEVENLGLLKQQEDIIKAYQQADVFVIPSLQDNLPNTVMESLACGVPVVAFNTGGIPEMVEHEYNGYITEQKNSIGLAAGIKWILEDVNRYEQLSKNARNKVMDTYTYTEISARYLSLYEKLLSQKS